MALTRFPGLIDIHVHLRDPGATHKEDFTTGSRAALKGGFTFVCDMPNNPTTPTNSVGRLEEKLSFIQKKALCDIGVYFGADGKNTGEFSPVWSSKQVFGLKIYCNHTTGELLVDDVHILEDIFKHWNSDKPILVHAEGSILEDCLELARLNSRRIHVCHVSKESDLARVQQAKSRGQLVTAGVTPHHLFLTREHVKSMGSLALVKPEIGEPADTASLWEGLRSGVIDLVESDHAPHTKEEKAGSTNVFGVPGLETTLGLMLKAVNEQKLTIKHVITFLYDNPKKIFSIPDQPDTYIELDPQKPYVVGIGGYETKCGWSPFDGWELYGKVEAVVLRGKQLVREGKLV